MAKLTSKAVENIKPIATRQEIPDALLPGLYLIVQPSGARSWAVRYRHNGKPRKHTLGPFPTIDLKTARALGTKVLRAAAEGRDPAAIEVTHTGAARVIDPQSERAGQGAATVEEHVGRYRELAEAGVQREIVGLSDADGPDSVRRFADVIAAFKH